MTYQGAEDQRVSGTLKIASFLGVREGLISDPLLETVEVLNLAGALCSGSVAEQGEDGGLDLVDVVQVQGGLDAGEEPLVRVLLGDLAPELGGALK